MSLDWMTYVDFELDHKNLGVTFNIFLQVGYEFPNLIISVNIVYEFLM